MFSRHDINSPKEARSLTDSPYWNLTDNDFVFAEPGAPRGVGERWARASPPPPTPSPLLFRKDRLRDTRNAVFYRC